MQHSLKESSEGAFGSPCGLTYLPPEAKPGKFQHKPSLLPTHPRSVDSVTTEPSFLRRDWKTLICLAGNWVLFAPSLFSFIQFLETARIGSIEIRRVSHFRRLLSDCSGARVSHPLLHVFCTQAPVFQPNLRSFPKGQKDGTHCFYYSFSISHVFPTTQTPLLSSCSLQSPVAKVFRGLCHLRLQSESSSQEEISLHGEI